MIDDLELWCPYCGEAIVLELERDTRGELIEDCPVCCQPIELSVRRDEWGDPQVDARRGAG